MTLEQFEQISRTTVHLIYTRDAKIIRQEIRERAMRNILKPLAVNIEEIPEDQLYYFVNCRVGIHQYNVSTTTTREEYSNFRRWHTSLNFFNRRNEPIDPDPALVNEVLWTIYGVDVYRVKPQGPEFSNPVGLAKKVIHYEIILAPGEPWEFWEKKTE